MPEHDAGKGATAGRPRLMFYVQHLLGMGHLVRAARIAEALDAAAFEVLFVMGGEPPPHLAIGGATLFALPPVKAGDGFHALVHPDGTPFDAKARHGRAGLLVDAFDTFAPDVLVTEAYPFGRRQMRFELVPLMERAAARADPPLVVASVRDILQRDRRPARVAETVDAVDRFFDLVLVHGDPRLAPFDDSFPDAPAFADIMAYTGLVVPPARASRPPAERFAVVVSAGGGAVGWPVMRAALDARPLTRRADAPWLILTGPNLAPDRQRELAAAAPPGVTIRAFHPDLLALLAHAEVSVSQAGYNTVGDLLVARCRSVLVPFASDGETEQSDRAARLADLGLAVVVEEAAVSGPRLAAAIDAALALPVPPHGLDLDGSATSARLIRASLDERTR